MLEALKTLNKWQPANVQNYCKMLVSSAVDTLTNHGFWVEDEAFRASNLFGVRLPESINMQEAKRRLDEAGVFVSYRGDCIRVSPGVYNQGEDLETLVNALIH